MSDNRKCEWNFHANPGDSMLNSEGYPDLTAYEAVQNEEKEHARFRKFMDLIFALCELSGYHLEGRIVVRDKKTGRIWR